MATENGWGARKIQAELLKLGIAVGISTVSRYTPKALPDPGRQQRWLTFLRNHREVITGMDFFVVPTVRFRLLYLWFAVDHGRRQNLHFNVTANPTSDGYSASTSTTTTRNVSTPRLPTHRSVGKWNHDLRSTPSSSECRVSAASTTAIVGPKPPDRHGFSASASASDGADEF
jgi:hypothetical protein